MPSSPRPGVGAVSGVALPSSSTSQSAAWVGQPAAPHLRATAIAKHYVRVAVIIAAFTLLVAALV
ncbi:hypothetical protein [Streptomyces sp. NPDC093261]|uniref:hypothetical protein n=1 Tax=Streptomyces sp. NPDC093261 TaxID=3366037 RepID=UPI0037F9ECA7